MFDWFKSREERTKDYNVIDFPKPVSVPTPEPKPEEHYRVGFTSDDQTTLTLMSNGGSMTLTMSRDACEQMIKMLRSTYMDEVEE